MLDKKKTVFVFCLLPVFVLLSLKTAPAQEVLYLSSSSQIARAFGKDVIEKYEERYEKKVNLHVGCSSTALVRLENGFSDLACIASRLPNEYRDKGYVDIPFAQDPLVVITNRGNSVQGLSRRQLRNVFMQNITNWKDIGGNDEEITVLLPRTETALFRNFERQVMGGFDVAYDFMSYMSTQNILGVKHIPGAVSIASLGAVKNRKGIRVLRIEGHEPRDEEYPFTQTFSFVSKGEPDQNAKEFIDAALSARGREIIREKGMQPIFKEEELREAY